MGAVKQARATHAYVQRLVVPFAADLKRTAKTSTITHLEAAEFTHRSNVADRVEDVDDGRWMDMLKAVRTNRIHKVVMIGGTTVTRVMVESILNASADFVLVGAVSDTADCTVYVDDLRPDLVLVAPSTSRMDAESVLGTLGGHRLLRKAVLTAEPLSEDALRRLTSAGASRVFDKSLVVEDHERFRGELRELMSRPTGELFTPDASLMIAAADSDDGVVPDRTGGPRLVPRTEAFSVVDHEGLRLTALHALGIANGGVDRRLDLIVKHLCHVTDYPMAAVTLIDETMQWTKAGWGLEQGAIPRVQAICNHTIRCSAPLVVSDTFEHPVFATFDVVTGAPHVRSYVGVPLIVETGFAIGALCLADHRPRPSVQTELSILTDMAALIVEMIDGPASRMAA